MEGVAGIGEGEWYNVIRSILNYGVDFLEGTW